MTVVSLVDELAFSIARPGNSKAEIVVITKQTNRCKSRRPEFNVSLSEGPLLTRMMGLGF